MSYGKKLRKVAPNVDRNKMYTLDDGVKLVIKNAGQTARKFVESLEIAINLGIDPRQSDQAVRGMVQLPHGTGKTVRVAVFAKGDERRVEHGLARSLPIQITIIQQLHLKIMIFSVLIGSRGSTEKKDCCSQRIFSLINQRRMSARFLFFLSKKNGSFSKASFAFFKARASAGSDSLTL